MIHKKNKYSIYVISLGCPKNRVDTEKFLGRLGDDFVLSNNLQISNFIFINTCAFIEPAVRESLRKVFDIAKAIKNKKIKPVIIVAGCMIGRYGKEILKKEIPEVDIWLTGGDIDEWAKHIVEYLDIRSNNVMLRLQPLSKSYSWLKIAEGCNNKCSFCVIPAIKGKYVSTKPELILDEAKFLLDNGVKEIDIVAQDVTSWGKDISNNINLLIQKLTDLENIKWLRLLYLYPEGINDDLLNLFSINDSPLLPYFDIPFQHSEPQILHKMGRHFHSSPQEIVEKIRSKISNAALRTSLIVGFPGETDQDFNKLCNFVKESRFHNLGVFKYCPEDGTRASLFKDQLPEKVKEERKEEILKIQMDISKSILQSYIGSTMDVLVDCEDFSEWPGLFKGRVWFQAPDIDGITYISGPQVSLGNFVKGEIENSYTYDLVAIN